MSRLDYHIEALTNDGQLTTVFLFVGDRLLTLSPSAEPTTLFVAQTDGWRRAGVARDADGMRALMTWLAGGTLVEERLLFDAKHSQGPQ